MEKGIKNIDIIVCKLRLASTRATNHRLEITREEQSKKEERVKRQRTETMAAKGCRDREGINLSSREEKNHGKDTRDDPDLDQAKNKYPH